MKQKALSVLFIIFLLFFFTLNLLNDDVEISNSERRKLKQFPNFSLEDIFDGSFMEDFDSYTVDQFVFRDEFRTIKANINYNLFKKLDNNGIYVLNNYIFKSEYPTNIKSIDNFNTDLKDIEYTIEWLVKRYTDDEIILYGCSGDEYKYTRNSNYDEKIIECE